MQMRSLGDESGDEIKTVKMKISLMKDDKDYKTGEKDNAGESIHHKVYWR